MRGRKRRWYHRPKDLIAVMFHHKQLYQFSLLTRSLIYFHLWWRPDCDCVIVPILLLAYWSLNVAKRNQPSKQNPETGETTRVVQSDPPQAWWWNMLQSHCFQRRWNYHLPHSWPAHVCLVSDLTRPDSVLCLKQQACSPSWWAVFPTLTRLSRRRALSQLLRSQKPEFEPAVLPTGINSPSESDAPSEKGNYIKQQVRNAAGSSRPDVRTECCWKHLAREEWRPSTGQEVGRCVPVIDQPVFNVWQRRGGKQQVEGHWQRCFAPHCAALNTGCSAVSAPRCHLTPSSRGNFTRRCVFLRLIKKRKSAKKEKQTFLFWDIYFCFLGLLFHLLLFLELQFSTLLWRGSETMAPIPLLRANMACLFSAIKFWSHGYQSSGLLS